MNIPEEILIQIISYTDPKDCILNLKFVNKEFLKLVNSTEFWGNLNKRLYHEENIENFIKGFYKKDNLVQSLQYLYLSTSMFSFLIFRKSSNNIYFKF